MQGYLASTTNWPCSHRFSNAIIAPYANPDGVAMGLLQLSQFRRGPAAQAAHLRGGVRHADRVETYAGKCTNVSGPFIYLHQLPLEQAFAELSAELPLSGKGRQGVGWQLR